MISQGKSVKDVVKGKKPKEVVKEVGHAVADVAFAGGAEKVLKRSKKYREKIAKDELIGAAYRKKTAKPNAATEKLKEARRMMNSKY